MLAIDYRLLTDITNRMIHSCVHVPCRLFLEYPNLSSTPRLQERYTRRPMRYQMSGFCVFHFVWIRSALQLHNSISFTPSVYIIQRRRQCDGPTRDALISVKTIFIVFFFSFFFCFFYRQFTDVIDGVAKSTSTTDTDKTSVLITYSCSGMF